MCGHSLGYSEDDLASSPYASFFQPKLDPVQPQVAEALLIKGQAHELFPTAEYASRMTDPGYWPIETGYTSAPDGSIRVFCLTNMPRVEPAMWDWWFGWHGSEALRYKLWHPAAHVEAKWADGRDDESYLGRTSLITEYLGSKLVKGAISFVSPSAMGIDESVIEAQGEVFICARIGVPGTPLRGGWLLHQLRPVEGGCEMRSRMWMGGENSALGDNPGALARGLARAMRSFAKSMLPDPAELLVHNAQEMAHLAGFLPELYEAFGPNSRRNAA